MKIAMPKKSNAVRKVSNNKRKVETCLKTITVYLEKNQEAAFLNTEQMWNVAQSDDPKTLGDYVTAARNSSEMLLEFAKMLKARKDVLEGQDEVSAYI